MLVLTALDGLGRGFELIEMPALMFEVVLDEKTKRNGLIFADNAQRRETFFGDAIHNGRKNLMLDLPPAHQCVPGLAGIAVRGDPGILSILRGRYSDRQ